MKIAFIIAFISAYGISSGQNPWKNIYSQHAWAERDKWQRADELIALLKIQKDSKVADIGSHEGYLTFKLAKVTGKNGRVYAVDLDQSKLDKIKKRSEELQLSQIQTIKGQPDDPLLPPDALDAAIILDTYHEMDDQQDILKHIKTALRKGGRLLICEPIADERRALSRSEQEQRHELALEFALDDVKEAGFKIVYQKDNFIDRTKEKGDKMWVLVVEKF